MRAYLIATFLLIAILGAIAGTRSWQSAGGSGAHLGPPPVTIAVATAVAEIWNTELEAVGTIRAARGVELSVEESGEVVAIAVSSGDEVKAGQLLLTLDDKVEQASRESQIASLDLARLIYERDAQLLQQKSSPRPSTIARRRTTIAPSHNLRKRARASRTSASTHPSPVRLASFTCAPVTTWSRATRSRRCRT